MLANINNTLLHQIKPAKKQFDVRDTKLKGFLVRVNPSGKMHYVCEFKRGRRINLGSTNVLSPMQARDRAKEILGDATKGIDPHVVKRQASALALKRFIENEYKAWVEVNRKSGAKTIIRIKRCFYKLFSDKPLNEITPILVDQWRTQRLKDGIAIETVNRDIATFKAAISKAVEWNLIETHPLAKFKLLRSDNSVKIRYLTFEEEQALRSALELREEQVRRSRQSGNEWRRARGYPLMQDLGKQPFVDYFKPMVLISLNTGLRQGELFTLDWQDIDLSRKILTIVGNKAKSGKTRHIPLNEQAADTLEKWQKQNLPGNLVFPNKEGQVFNNVRKTWVTVLTKAKIHNFRWHDMRHHFASRLVMAGVDLNTVRELLGHSDIKMTLRYAHLAPEHKAQAVAKLLINNNAKLVENAQIN